MDFPKSVPNIGLVDGKFVDENQLAGTPGSLIPSVWGNAVTTEILNVIEDAGIEPSEATLNQLKIAINNKIAYATRQATEEIAGVMEVATTLQVDAAEDDKTAITPLKLGRRLTDLLPTATESLLGRIRLATNAQALGGLDDAAAITSLKLKNKLVDYIKQATELAFGWAKVATQSITDAGTDDSAYVTAKKLRWGFSISLGTNSCIVFPTWLGSFMIQFGISGGIAPNTTGTVNFPVGFAAGPRGIWITYVDGAANSPATRGAPAQVGAYNATLFNYSHAGSASGAQHFWLAIGK